MTNDQGCCRGVTKISWGLNEMALEDSPSWQSVIPKSRPNFNHQGLPEVMAGPGPESARAGSDSGLTFRLPYRESEAWERPPFQAATHSSHSSCWLQQALSGHLLCAQDCDCDTKGSRKASSLKQETLHLLEEKRLKDVPKNSRMPKSYIQTKWGQDLWGQRLVRQSILVGVGL